MTACCAPTKHALGDKDMILEAYESVQTAAPGQRDIRVLMTVIDGRIVWQSEM